MLKKLENGLVSTDFYIISKLGVAQTIPTTLRCIPHQLCGMELNSLLAETTVSKINFLLQHYGTEAVLGTTQTVSIEYLQSEIWVTGCQLLYDCSKY